MLIFVLIIDVQSTQAKTASATVDTDSLHIRSGPGLSYDVTGSLNKDEKVDVVSTSEDWLEIKAGDKTGWIASWLTANSDVGELHSVITSQVNSLNVRSEPSLDSKVLGQMNAGDEATLSSTKDNWAHIQLNGNAGWVHTDYIAQNAEDKPTETTKKADSYTVGVDALNVRQKADLTSKRVELIYKGDSYKVKEIDGNWIQIELSKGNDGWVYSFHGTLSNVGTSGSVNGQTPKEVNILSDGTNIRKDATTSSEIVVRANAGDQFDIVSEVNDWYELKLPSGETAFVANWVVTIDDEIAIATSPEVEKIDRVPGTLKGLTIVLDPGHGGKDNGTTGINGTEEKDITLLTSKVLAEKLRKAGATVHLTRDEDSFLSLQQRVSSSHTHRADAFVSVHYDATTDSSISGFTTYYTHESQKELANAVNNGMDSKLSIRNRGAQPGNYKVLRDNKQNAILVELGFLSNPVEEKTVTTDSFREQATLGIYEGLLDFFDSELD